jgi:hypothetical protein
MAIGNEPIRHQLEIPRHSRFQLPFISFNVSEIYKKRRNKWVRCTQCNYLHNQLHYDVPPTYFVGSVVGIATVYGLDSPGIEFR